ncbi:MAG: hypothetical protein EBT03_10805 [Betaproteobacteria bacterium]|nr:hypothetical protein [Betaproteobacteria bacterium]NCA16977.1 hypothetical protein [Betaproteobacteria bacterium]
MKPDPAELRLLQKQRGQAEFLPGRQALAVGEAAGPIAPVSPPVSSSPSFLSSPWFWGGVGTLVVVGLIAAKAQRR